ncbi:sensor histidine kinase [Paenibacillus sp. BSR1-1]|uniref:cache domain-containing sensor histidine kinase n=1 Tax=Paenibacillus sp. BSR1-1 TaxID=3020845 RepID=UPI0025B1A731|nr:sensor histidine kinase [Paenibacillus sp. BSR1-1]MDN3015604.1 sensor histidine kinase [Paenibacillus sp. BSR1-1]
MQFANSIFFKLLLSFVLISVIPLSFVGWITYDKYSRNLYEKLEYHANYILSQKMKSLNTFLFDLERMQSGMRSSNVFSQFLANNDPTMHPDYYLKLDNLMESIQTIRPETVGITIISNNGFVYNYGYSLNMKFTKDHFNTLPWLKEIEKNNLNPLITNLHTREYSNLDKNQKVYSYVQKVWDKKLRSFGYIVIDFKPELLQNILNSELDTAISSGTFIYDRHGFVLSPKASTHISFDSIQKQKSGFVLQKAHDKNYLIFKQFNPTTKWYVSEYFEVGEFYKPVNEVKFIAWIITITSVIICILAAMFISHRISQPIRRLQQAMKNVKSGDLDQTFHVKSKDEIGELGRGFNEMIVQIKKLIQSVSKEEKLKKAAEITALQLQINPHFLYNTLESINSLARIKKEHEISHLIVLLGRLLRLSISSFEEKIPIHQEIMYIESYLEIQKVRMRDPLDYTITLEDGIKNCLTTKLILQPIVENAIIHGIDPLRTFGRIKIEGKFLDEMIIFTIADNGKGIHPEQLEQIRERLKNNSEELSKYKKKIGLYNVQTRIRSHYGENFGISIDSKVNKGTTVTIKFPIEVCDFNEKNVDCG